MPWKNIETAKVSQISDLKKWLEKMAAQFSRPCFIFLEGELGAGKTELVKQHCLSLGIQDVSSPTFSIYNTYLSKPPIQHWDLYRISSETELESSGFWDELTDMKGPIFIEWSSRILEITNELEWFSSYRVPTYKIKIYKDEKNQEARLIEFDEFL